MFKTYYKPDQSDNYYPQSKKNTESICIFSIGYSKPWPNYETQIMRRELYVLHYVKSGSIFYLGRVWQAPLILLMTPDKPQWYKIPADSLPYEQYWIVFSGTVAKELLEKAGLPSENAVIPCPYVEKAYQIFEELTDAKSYTDVDDSYYMLSGFFRLLALHPKSLSQKEKAKNISPIIQEILNHIHQNYAERITEQDLANLVNLSTNYMHRRFCAEVGMPPIHYLNRYRIRCAKRLLVDSEFSIARISESVGIPDSNYFCRVFQKHSQNRSPSEYRKQHKQTQRN